MHLHIVFSNSRTNCIAVQAKKTHFGTIQGPYVQGYAYSGNHLEVIPVPGTKVVKSGTVPSIPGPLRAMYYTSHTP